MNTVYLGIGGNMGDRWLQMQICRMQVEELIGAIISKSRMYETKAWGETNQPDFYNQVLCIETNFDAMQVLHICQNIEINMGRVRNQKWQERIIDIDILFFNNEIIVQENYSVPHPYLHLRKFVLLPLADIASNFLHPILKKTIDTLLLECNDDLDVRIVDLSNN